MQASKQLLISMGDLHTKADSVRLSVASASTCSPATVTTLNELLLLNTTNLETKAPPAVKSAAKTRSALQSKTAKGVRLGVKSINDGDINQSAVLSPKERAILATEVINSTLKSLSKPIKSQNTIRRPPSSSKECPQSPARKALRRTSSLPHSPLEQRSLSRVSSSPSITPRIHRSSSLLLNGNCTLRPTAECSRAAFACLRGLQAAKTSCADLPPFQLESGMSALIGKLVNLGFDDLALKELRILKRRLDFALKPSELSQIRTVPTTDVPRPQVQSLIDLLDFEFPPTAGAALAIAIATQLQVLKLIATSKKPSSIKAALEKLQPDYQGSPTQLIVQSAKESAPQATKAARQLESLSQLVLSLGPSISSSEDAVALSEKSHVSPSIALQFQVLAFQNRRLWWNFSHHQGNIKQDILEPFSRCLSTFARRTLPNNPERCRLAQQAFQTIQLVLQKDQLSIIKHAKSPMISIYKVLASLAYDSGSYDDAVKWMEMVRKLCSEMEISDVQQCAINARLAGLKLRILPHDKEVEDLLMMVIEGVEGSLKGESQELDELLSEISLLRRAAILLLSKQRISGINSHIDGGTRQMCESLVLLCPRFSLRYLGSPPATSTDVKNFVRYEQRQRLLSKSVLHTVDSALFLLKRQQSDNRLTWELMDSVLPECLRLLDNVGKECQELFELKEARASYYVRISNLYYTQHLNLRRDAESPKDLQHLRALRRSIECIRMRPIAERKAAMLTLKLERLAEIFKLIGRYDEAGESLLSLIDELVDNGVLSLTAARAATLPLGAIWEHDEEACTLARAVALLIKLEVKRNPKSPRRLPVVNQSWTAEELGTMLEHHLTVLSQLGTESTILQQKVSRELLLIYDQKTFPIRRLRAVTNILRLSSEQRCELTEDTRSSASLAGLPNIIDESRDLGLGLLAPHLQALALSNLELLEEHPRIDLIKPHLATWCSIAKKCKDYATLSCHIDNVPDLLRHLRAVSDFLDMKGFGKTRAAVLRLIATINEIPRPAACPDDVVLSFNELALQFLDLGYSGKAGLALDRAQCLASCNGVTLQVISQVHISHAAYLLKIGNSEKCEESLLRAQSNFLHGLADDSTEKRGTSSSKQDQLYELLARAYKVCSMLALERGLPQVALSHAKHSLKLQSRGWLRMEKVSKRRNDCVQQNSVDGVAGDVSSLSTSKIKIATSPEEVCLALSAWELVRPLFRSLIYLSEIYAHNGMFQETIYYTEQAHKVASSANSSVFVATALASSGIAWLKAGTLTKAAEQLMRARELAPSLKETQAWVILNCHLGSLYNRQENQVEELAAYDAAEAALKTLMDPKYINEFENIIDPAAILEAEMSRLALHTKKPTVTPVPSMTVRRRAPVRKVDVRAKLPAEAVSSVSDECAELLSLKGMLLRQRAYTLMLCKRLDDAVATLRIAESFSYNKIDTVDQRLGIAKQLIFESISQMASDPVYSVLKDSTISFPAVVGTTKLLAATADRISGVRLSPPRRMHASSRSISRSKSPSSQTFFDKLRQAQDYLTDAHLVAQQVSSTTVIHKISLMLNATIVLLSAAGTARGKPNMHPGFATCFLEMARSDAFYRERAALLVLNPKTDVEWPMLGMNDLKKINNGSLPDLLCFQQDYIDIIPSDWMAISISLSENRQELCLAKFQAGDSPFVLRLPLGRNNSRDMDEEVFDFEQGKSELLEIIENANTSAHGARNINGRGAKAAWWAEREALDDRLKGFLENVEKVWLGGFRGIFSQSTRHSDLLTRFQQSFQNTLDKHLPSRRRIGKNAKAPRVTLDIRILELFVGLGNTSIEDGDLDEPLTDLLYFVVDILQFHGERNAYDEIDFDSIAIETQDALKCYYEAIDSEVTSDGNKHTILIVDKSLHAFPWESLPCMDGLAVSRLPSLGCLRDRILNQQNESEVSEGGAGPEGHYIDGNIGGYLLNPGGDLKSTQTAFEGELQALDGWDGIMEREPSEPEVKEMLETKELFLYFGHGSGAQYIRSKTIKKLEKCAVTVLMGCSSGALTDVGDFEPYGPPVSYMLAGSPAVVATLWDVTDKDIDRFAKSAFAHWGLFTAQSLGTENTSKGKGRKKEKVATASLTPDKVSLVEAVTRGRKACNLKYLTAAAVCVYGIPVYIK